MACDGCKICAIFLFVLLLVTSICVYYREHIQDYFDDSPKIIYHNEPLVNAFLIKKYYQSKSFSHNKLTIHAANYPNEIELYRIDWYQSINLTLTRIKDKFVVSRAQRIDPFVYSFELFGQSMTTRSISQRPIDKTNFDINYTDYNHTISNLVLRSCKQEIQLLFTYVRWNVIWFDITQRFSVDNRGRLNIEIMNPGQQARLSEKVNLNDFDPGFGSAPNPYVYDLYVFKNLPKELFLTTLIIADYVSHGNCN